MSSRRAASSVGKAPRLAAERGPRAAENRASTEYSRLGLPALSVAPWHGVSDGLASVAASGATTVPRLASKMLPRGPTVPGTGTQVVPFEPAAAPSAAMVQSIHSRAG